MKKNQYFFENVPVVNTKPPLRPMHLTRERNAEIKALGCSKHVITSLVSKIYKLRAELEFSALRYKQSLVLICQLIDELDARNHTGEGR